MAAKTDSKKNNDTMLKVVALVCALLLWFYAEAQENPSKERQLTVPVQYINLAEGYVIEHAESSVQVVVKGNETDIMSLRSDDFAAVVDLTGAAVGSMSYPVQVTGTAVNERFTFTPDKLTVVIDQIQQKDVPVQLRTEGVPAQYYELKHTEIQPEVVTIRGKSTILNQIHAVETEVADISGMKTDTELTVKLVLPDGVTVRLEDGSFAAVADVTAALHVQAKQSERTLETSVILRNVPDGLTAVPDVHKVSMVLSGDTELLETQPILDQLLLYVDCSDLTAGTYTLPIAVESSNEAVHNALQMVSPQTVTVTLQWGNAAVPEVGDLNEIEDNQQGQLPKEQQDNQQGNN